MEKGLGLLLERSGREFSVSTGSTEQVSSVVARFANKTGEDIDLVTGLINLLADEEDQLGEDALKGWTTLTLYELQIRYDRFKNPVKKQYGIQARVAWKPKIDLGAGEHELNVGASLDLRKMTGEKVTGEICGVVQTPIEGIEFLRLGACLRMQKGAVVNGKATVDNNIFFFIQMGRVTFEAAYSKPGGNLHLDFKIKIAGELTLGDVVTFFASLVDPSIEEYEFDPPWDFISRVKLNSLLENLTFSFESSADKKKSFGFRITDVSGLFPSEIQPFLSIASFGLKFTSSPKSTGSKQSRRKTEIQIAGTFLGKTFTQDDPLKWDPVDGKAPEVPGKGAAVFDLRYLGLGQHVAFTKAASVNSIKEVMDALRGTLEDNQAKLVEDRSLSMGSPQNSFLAAGGPIAFSAESEWLIGLDVSLLKMLNLSIIFNDPLIYGLRIELYGEAAKNFKGFVFEILYTKVSDTIGKYHGELVLPDLFRRMDFGSVTVILPGIIVDVYTNGDFAVDLGFPRNFNFTLSFAMELFPFVGAGGFYFRKLSAETATSTPKLHANDKGVFTPVYEFGLGLKLGLGKSFNKGPLKAEISITLQGIIEGVISWYRPADGSEETAYYKLQGGVRIVGRLYGAVDFVIIAVEIEVVAQATILFVFEVYKDIQILLSASVSVSATVKVAFIKIRKHFEMTVEQHFTIDSPTGHDTPWLVG